MSENDHNAPQQKPPENGDGDNIKKFPAREELEKIRAAQQKAEQQELMRQRLVQQKFNLPDQQPIINLPPVTKALMFLMIGIFVLQSYVPPFDDIDFLLSFAFIPARYLPGAGFSWEAVFTPITCMFLHASWLHLMVNVLTLAAFGAGLEKYLGGRRFIALFLMTGFFASMSHLLVGWGSNIPLMGASGGVSGLFGAVLLMMQEMSGQKTSLKRLLPAILVWIGISIFFGVVGMPGAGGDIAWAVHIGGFFAGLALYKLVIRYL